MSNWAGIRYRTAAAEKQYCPAEWKSESVKKVHPAGSRRIFSSVQKNVQWCPEAEMLSNWALIRYRAAVAAAENPPNRQYYPNLCQLMPTACHSKTTDKKVWDNSWGSKRAFSFLHGDLGVFRGPDASWHKSYGTHSHGLVHLAFFFGGTEILAVIFQLTSIEQLITSTFFLRCRA